jgi:hypothetical protein
MDNIWFIGFIGIILFRAFYAGMNSKALFYRAPRYGESGAQFDESKLLGYGLVSLGVGVSWPISLPVLGVYMLGQRFNKGK